MDKQKISVRGHYIRIIEEDGYKYICLTDIAKADPRVEQPNDVIKNYLRKKSEHG